MSEFKIIWGGDVLTANTSCEASFLGVGNDDHKELLESKFLDGDTLKEDEPNDTTADVYILEEDGDTRNLHVFPTGSQDGIVATYKIDNDGDSCKLLNDTSNIWYKELDITQESGAMFTVIADYDDWNDDSIQSTSSRIVDNSSPKDWFSFPQSGDRVCKFKFKTNDQAATNASMFMGCTSLKSVVLPYSITSISANTFNGCSNLVSYGDVDHITSIGNYAFSDCTSLITAEFGKFLTSTGNKLGVGAFSGCTSLTNINYYIEDRHEEPDDCHKLNIPNSCFKGCTSLKGNNDKTQLYIYGNVGVASFSGCTSLTSIDISNIVTSIGSNAFQNCSGLTSVTVNALTPPDLGSYVFNNTNNCPIYVPSRYVDRYKEASGWSIYASRIQAIQ